MSIYIKAKLLTLKAKIKGLAASGLKTRELINKSTGKKRDGHWNIKRLIGQETRYHLIAYGLIRGKSYNEIEPNSNKERIKYYNFNYLSEICLRNGSGPKYTPDYLRKLILTDSVDKNEKPTVFRVITELFKGKS